MKASILVCGALWSVLVTGCGAPSTSQDLIFVDGRAVASAGDSLLAIARQGERAITVRERETGAVFPRGEQALTSPHHVQERAGIWYVSDAAEEGVWRWLDGTLGEDRSGTEVVACGYSDWLAAEPNDGGAGEDVAHMWAPRGYGWNDTQSDGSYDAICEYFE